MKANSKIKLFLSYGLVILALVLAFHFGQSVAQHGGLGAYLEARREAERLRDALGLINNYYVDGEPVELESLTESALRGMISKLDPYSEYLDSEQLNQLREDTSQEFGGLGIQVEMLEDRLTIVAPIEGTPAFEAGLLRGDQIIEVDGDSIIGMPLSETLKLLRGRPGTSVDLLIYRPSNDQTLAERITRERIEVDSVKSAQLLDDRIGYLRILQFGGKTAEETKKAIDLLVDQGMQALIIDLRNNPGGLLESAVDIVELFVERRQLVVYTEGRHEFANDQWYAEASADPYRFPVAILVNGGSASASEIVAGALKDIDRAVVVGDKTFGKGSVQSILPIDRGSGLRLTTAKYYTPGGYVIHGHGIEPHVIVPIDVEDERKLAIQRNRQHLMSREEFVERFEFEPIEDLQRKEAMDQLILRLDARTRMPEA